MNPKNLISNSVGTRSYKANIKVHPIVFGASDALVSLWTLFFVFPLSTRDFLRTR